ncbi:MAG: DNA-processing protein DprA, partial [Candidatus Marsarchaeota archaeon]|nr:DNA-processing protein DprA [Candidatus Marsarchaeota archaeon]
MLHKPEIVMLPACCQAITNRLWAIGNADLINRRMTGLLCSIQCPGDIIVKTLDLMQELKNADVCVVSGFHSPMEQECLKVLLNGSCGLILCPARSLIGMRTPSKYRPLLDAGRLLLVSPFDEKHKRKTRETADERNHLVASLSDVLLIPYASPDGSIA